MRAVAFHHYCSNIWPVSPDTRVPDCNNMAAATKAAKKKVVKKIMDWATRQCGGSGDIEKRDAVHIVEPDILASAIKAVRARLEIVDPTWAFRRTPVSIVTPPQPNVGVTATVFLSPLSLGFEEGFSDKGKSKMINIFECIQNFLERPYNSVENPLYVRYGPESKVGQNIEGVTVYHRIGFTKSLAAKAIILAIVEVELTDDELITIQDCAQALFSLHATFQQSDHMNKDERFNTLRKKFEEASRPRPDPIQVVYSFSVQAQHDGWPYADVVNSYIAAFNSGSSVETKQLSELEQDVIKVFPALTSESQCNGHKSLLEKKPQQLTKSTC